jgi:hypothetical protein
MLWNAGSYLLRPLRVLLNYQLFLMECFPCEAYEIDSCVRA